MKIMSYLCPPSKKMVHIALLVSVGWSVYLDSRFLTACETYELNKDRLTPKTSTWYPHCIVLQTREGRGGGKVKIITDFGAAGGVNVYFHKDFNCYICIDAAAAEWHIPSFIRRSKQLFPLLYSQMLFYVICNYVCLLHRPVCN